MSHAVIHSYEHPETIAQVRDITTDNVWKWLAAGWSDLRAAPGPSLMYGLAVAVVSYLLVVAIVMNSAFFFLLPLLAGFFFLAPLLGVGLYDMSKQLETGGKPSFRRALSAWQANSFHLIAMGVVLVVAFIAWGMLANLIFALFFQGITPTYENFLPTLLTTADGLMFLGVGLFAGAIIAGCVFTISAVAVPMLFDRKANVFDAIQTSYTAVRYNILPMLLWAIVLAVIIGVGFVTLFVGLVVGFPLAAHATWHAYRDLVEKE